MKRIVILLFFVLSLQTAFSQEFEIIRHQVKMGETVRMLSKKYKVEPSEIYRLNKFAIDGISQGMVLQILVPKKEEVPTETAEQPVAESTETTTTQSQDNPDEAVSSSTTTTTKTTVIKKKKPVDGSSEETPREEPSVVTSISTESSEQTATHTVAKGETLFSIAKRYNVTVDDIKSQNEALQKHGIQPGQVLTIVSKTSTKVVEKVPDNVNQATTTTAENNVSSNSDSQGITNVTHTVVKGDTLYSLSKKYDVSVEAIKMQNEQALKKGLQIGQVLVIGIGK